MDTRTVAVIALAIAALGLVTMAASRARRRAAERARAAAAELRLRNRTQEWEVAGRAAEAAGGPARRGDPADTPATWRSDTELSGPKPTDTELSAPGRGVLDAGPDRVGPAGASYDERHQAHWQDGRPQIQPDDQEAFRAARARDRIEGRRHEDGPQEPPRP
ncbi:MAG: hypothetical protein M9891_09825 [Austwickia sp.]|nr:hypothetical protein [Actinomycetota bacterium]MCB1254460.1 hypothetical protein [Austwickia sp.]MCO5309572.1 hypothetical protein [Austwickia sp.]